MCYNGFNSTIGYYRGKHDSANSIVAGALSGDVVQKHKRVQTHDDIWRHCGISCRDVGCKSTLAAMGMLLTETGDEEGPLLMMTRKLAV